MKAPKLPIEKGGDSSPCLVKGGDSSALRASE